jgi:hypothetical protein
MSTRANVVIIYGESRVYIYRHHDGYPAGLGVDLARKVQAAGHNPSKLVESLLAERYEQQSYETAPKSVYELTTDIHGDIEYVYRVVFEHGGGQGVRIGYSHRSFDGPGPETVARLVRTGPLAEFVESVNRDVRAQNARLAKLRAEQPAVYGKYEDEPEVALS